MSYDNVCKYLAEQYPASFVRWLLNIEPSTVEVLKTELTIEPIRADAVTFLQTTDQILHIEFQTSPISDPPMALRMLDYSVRLKRQYRCDVAQVVIFLQETTGVAAFTEEYRDNTTIHHYRVVRLWEQDPALFLSNPELLPLAPLTRTDSPTVLLGQVAAEVERIGDRRQKTNIAGCLDILAGLRFEKDLIRRFIREDIMRESVTYQDIWERSRKQEATSLVMRQLNRKLGEINSRLIEQIQLLTTEKIELLGEALISFSEIPDLVTWLEQNK
ncbi:MAG: Rpn family recombination-promoting nuclease/putative transposase [Crinalium sp.]